MYEYKCIQDLSRVTLTYCHAFPAGCSNSNSNNSNGNNPRVLSTFTKDSVGSEDKRPKTLKEVQSPAFVVSLPKLKHNCERLLKLAKERNVNLRPHVKTHKTIQAAKLQTLNLKTPQIVASTLSEVRFFAQGGFRDITYGVPITPNKLDLAADVLKTIDVLHLFVDQKSHLEAVVKHAQKNNIRWSVFLKVDTGYHRHGIDPRQDTKRVLELVRLLNESESQGSITFYGLYSHSGHAYGGKTEAETESVVQEEVDVMNYLVDLIEKNHLKPPPVVSIGSTPSCTHLPRNLGRVNEIHPGNYSFFDQQQVDLKSCTPDEIAGYVIARVTSTYPLSGTFTTDCGALGLSKDKISTQLPLLPDRGFGILTDYPHLYVASVSQEGGIIKSHDPHTLPIDYSKFTVGTIIRINPNHSCLTSACYEKYWIVDDNENIIDCWQNCRGW